MMPPLDGEGAAPRVVRHARAAHRLRLAVPGLRGDPAKARRVEAALRGWPGVREARADATSGRVLVRFSDGAALGELAPAPPAPSGAPRAHRPPREGAPFHALPVDEVLEILGTSRRGLAEAEARGRLRRVGANAVEVRRPRSPLATLAAQLADVPSALLLGAATLASALGELLDVGAILGVLAVNAGIGFSVERGNEQLLASWDRAEAGEDEVLRDGRPARVSARELVPGDVLLLRAGAVLSADARVIDAQRLACDEAPLTGESEPRPKRAEPAPAEAPLAERSSMLYAGTTVVRGRGRAVVTATGPDTEQARVRRLIEHAARPQTPLARRLSKLSNRVAAAAVGGAGVAAAAGLLRGRSVAAIARGGVALALAAVPEGLPVVSTAALVRSMKRMRRDGMVVRRLQAAETLGGVTVICCDKTGTLTRNEMRAELADVGDGPRPIGELRARHGDPFADRATLLCAAALLNSEVDLQRGGGRLRAVSGSSTERALVDAALAAGLDAPSLRRALPTRFLRERDGGVHYVVSVHDVPGDGAVAFAKGAPEQIVALCDREWERPLDDAARARILARNDALADAGLRVLALAWRPLAGRAQRPPDDGYRYLGLIALADPLREGAADAIRDAARAGIRTIIVTGDQRRTAEAIAREVGLAGEALDAAEAVRLAAARAPAAWARLGRAAVLSRVSPADKAAVVEALRRSGEIVAMAGDGINDAPALKVADVGIAVGRGATDLARQVADVVLANEDLASILAAVAEGRIVQDNLRRAVRFLFATNLSEMALVLGAALVGARDPLTPIQLLWINLLTDTLPALALALETGDRSVLGRPPAPPDAPILSPALTRRIVRDGLLMASAGAAAFAIGGPPLAFAVLSGVQLGYAATCRAPGAGGARFRRLVGGTVAAQALALALPPARALLRLPGSPLPSLAGFTVGYALPGLVARATAPEIVRKKGGRSP